MLQATKVKLYSIREFILDRLSERGTWQGIGFFCGIFISKDWAQMDWGMAAFVGGAISGIIKIVFPDATKNEINVTVVRNQEKPPNNEINVTVVNNPEAEAAQPIKENKDV